MKENNRDILSEIIANKRFEIDSLKRIISPEQLMDTPIDTNKHRSMRHSLEQSASGIISEFKRRSPSKGWICRGAKVGDVIPGYEKAGAAALSILTDEKFFGGNLKDVRQARPLTNLPILRKDFIIDEYQLFQAKIIGADAVLLIAAALEKEQCEELTRRAHDLGLEVLLEIHREDELEYIGKDTDMVGINNRNLGSFVTDVDNSFRLAEALPTDILLISESGISDPEVVNKLRERGFRGFLIGETFMKTENPEEALRLFIAQLNEPPA